MQEYGVSPQMTIRNIQSYSVIWNYLIISQYDIAHLEVIDSSHQVIIRSSANKLKINNTECIMIGKILDIVCSIENVTRIILLLIVIFFS